MDFTSAFDFVLGREGGYVNDPHDPGGETNFGITKRDHPDLDIKNLSIKKAREIYTDIKKEIPQVVFDDNGNIGKRYRRQDEIGTPLCVTIDFDTLDGDEVTVFDEDSDDEHYAYERAESDADRNGY